MDTPATPDRSFLVSSPASRTRWRARGVAGLAVAAWALVVSGVARADDDPPGRVGRVAQVSGDVRTVNADGAWVPLPRNQPLTTGDRVITDKDGRAVVQVGSSTVRLGAYSDLSVVRLDDEHIRLHFDHGQMALRVRSADILGELGIETDEGLWVPHHAGYFRFDRVPGQALAAQAWSGDMLLEAPDSSLPIAAGQRAELWREGAQQTTHYRMVAVPTDKFSDWALVEDRLDDRYAASAAASSPVPAEMTGATDLNRYGRWTTAADVGSVWYPNEVAPGWQPYQDGNWSWVAPWGWTWVDNSPWGFAPFHYGRWVSVRGRWCWAPGNWGPRPIYAPALVGWFGGEGFSVGGAPAVGWVPLAPNEPFYPGYAVSPIYWNLVNGPIGHPPIRRPPPGPVTGRPRIVPVGPISYANRGVPGAVAIVPAGSLATPQPVSSLPALQRPDHKRLVGQASEGRVSALPPPAPPAGRGMLARTAPVLQVPATGGVAPATPAAPIAPAATAAPAPVSPTTGPGRQITAPRPATPAVPARPGLRPVGAAASPDAPATVVAPVAPVTPTATPVVAAPAAAATFVPAAPIVAPALPVAPAAPGIGLGGGPTAPRSGGGGGIGTGVRGDPRDRR